MNGNGIQLASDDRYTHPFWIYTKKQTEFWARSQESSTCMHDSCLECHGTFRRQDGTACVHMISCPCKKCNPTRC